MLTELSERCPLIGNRASEWRPGQFVRLNGHTVDDLTVGTAAGTAQLLLSAGINQLTVTGAAGNVRIDRVRTRPASAAAPVNAEAKSGLVTGDAEFSDDFPFASGQVATNVGDGHRHVLVIRYANAQESIPTTTTPTR